MRSGNVRSVSFTFHKSSSSSEETEEKNASKKGVPNNPFGTTRKCLKPSTRQNLQNRFDKECPFSLNQKEMEVRRKNSRSSLRKWSDFNLSLPTVQPRRMLRTGADKISKTFTNVRNSFDTLSQRLRASTRRRYRLENESPQPVTPRTKTKCILGRTPTKLYSPFGIETPQNQLRTRSECSSGGKITPRRSYRQRSNPYGGNNWMEDMGTPGRYHTRSQQNLLH